MYNLLKYFYIQRSNLRLLLRNETKAIYVPKITVKTSCFYGMNTEIYMNSTDIYLYWKIYFLNLPTFAFY